MNPSALRRGPSEAAVLRACLELLALRRIPAWRQNTGAFAVGEGKARRYVRAGTKGCADILGILPPSGRFLAVETKRPGGRLRPDQRAFLDAVAAAGGLALVVSDVTQLAAALAAEGT